MILSLISAYIAEKIIYLLLSIGFGSLILLHFSAES